MTLLVEDGTGIPGAESYLAVAGLRAYCTKWGHDLGAATDETLETRLRVAAGFIDTVFRYKGSKLTAAQSLEFPRLGLTDWGGLEVTGVPLRVTNACAELAFKSLSSPLYQDLDRGGMISSKTVGPLSVSYEAGAPAGKVYTFAEKLLAQYIRKDGEQITGPFFSTSDAPVFGMGMHDIGATDPVGE